MTLGGIISAFYTVPGVSNMKRMCDDGYKLGECELICAKIAARVWGDTVASSVGGTQLTVGIKNIRIGK